MVKVVQCTSLNVEVYSESNPEIKDTQSKIKYSVVSDGVETFFVNREDTLKILELIKNSGVTKTKSHPKKAELELSGELKTEFPSGYKALKGEDRKRYHQLLAEQRQATRQQ